MSNSITIDIAADGGPLSSLEADWLFIPVTQSETNVPIEQADAATGGELSRAMASGEFKAKKYRVLVTPVVDRQWRPRRIALVGGGDVARFDAQAIWRLASIAGMTARDRHAASIAFVCRQPGPPASARMSSAERLSLIRAIAEALVYSTFDAAPYKTEDHELWEPKRFVLSVPGADSAIVREATEAARSAAVLGDCVNLARSLANEPGNRLRPLAFAERAAHVASAAGVAVKVLDESQIADLGMGMLLGVARGSEEPPRLLVMKHQPEAAKGRPVLGLVGKGVTFDTGGLSIKPSQGMDRMKDDMAGGAAVVAAMCAIARLRAPVAVIGVVPIAENMPSGQAIRPGDVLRSASGKTVEVLDTDAEGRLILGDALWYAGREGATHLVDVATLTGACTIALGHGISGLFARPAQWAAAVRAAADAGGDIVWPLPLYQDYLDLLRSDIADLKNVGGRPAGAITAAMFLSEFAGDVPWAHLDIAGTAWTEEAKDYLPKGPTGVGVKTLTTLAFADLP